MFFFILSIQSNQKIYTLYEPENNRNRLPTLTTIILRNPYRDMKPRFQVKMQTHTNKTHENMFHYISRYIDLLRRVFVVHFYTYNHTQRRDVPPIYDDT